MELFLYIPLGLIGLTLVVFVHEAGHFLAARWMGVEVEAFALGWGKVLWSWKPGPTEYRICLLPLGGYCKLKGDQYLVKAIEGGVLEGANPTHEPEPGSFHAAAPWRRIVISAAGPVFNLVLTFLVFFVLQCTGVPQHTTSGRIVLLSDSAKPGQTFPATEAGLQTGDVVTSIDGSPVRNFLDIQSAIAKTGSRALLLQVKRGDAQLTVSVAPRWIAEEKRALIGISNWIDPVIEHVVPGKQGDIVGFQDGDRITSIAGVPIRNTSELGRALQALTIQTPITVQRANKNVDLVWIPQQLNSDEDLGLEFQLDYFPPVGKPLPEALLAATDQTANMVGQMAGGLAQLVTGQVKASDSLSGPLRISYLVGEQTSRSFVAGTAEGFIQLLNDLSFLSLALFFMNLLPIPALDGGSILLHVYEGLRRKRTSLRFLIRYQQIGGVVIVLLVLFTLFNDTSFLMGPK